MEISIPHVIYILGPRNSGKSTLVREMLTNYKLFKQRFDSVYVFSPTFKYQSVFSDIKFDENKVFDNFDETKIEEIIEENKKYMGEVLIILDDCITSTNFKKTNNDHPLSRIASIGRHFKISIWCISQKLNAISTTFRTNCDGVILFRTNILEQKEAFQTWSGPVSTFNEFQQIFDHCTKERYNFLYYNNQNNSFYHNFNKLKLTKKLDQTKI